MGRGGGSIEDLWAFNEEEVARAIYNSKIPIISSVGHETDTTIADFVADLRAPTPTAAAEMATPDFNTLELQRKDNFEFIKTNIKNKITIQQGKLKIFEENQYFKEPLLSHMIKMDNINEVIIKIAYEFKNKLAQNHNKLNNTIDESNRIIDNKLKQKSNNLVSIHQELDALNPLSILSRGYAVPSSEGKVIKSIRNINIGDQLSVNVEDGIIQSTVISKENNE